MSDAGGTPRPEMGEGVALPLGAGLRPEQARRFVRTQAEGSGLGDDDVDRVVQVAGELIAAGVESGDGARLVVHESEGGVVVTIDRPLDLTALDDEAALVRGQLLDALADGWGSAPDGAGGDGAATWAAVRRTP